MRFNPRLALIVLLLAVCTAAWSAVRPPDENRPLKLLTVPNDPDTPIVVWLAYEGFEPYEKPDLKADKKKPKKPLIPHPKRN